MAGPWKEPGTERHRQRARKAKEVLKSGEPIILILSDLTMPGTNGRFWRSTPSLAELPILICTAQDPKHWYDAADCLGISGHIAKPLKTQELIERVAFVLESALIPVEDMATVLRRLQISAEVYMDKNSSKAGSYRLPMAWGLIWKQVANTPTEAVSK